MSTVLPRRRCFPRSRVSLPCYPFLQDEGSPARSVSLSQCSRARCNVPCKVLAIARATMTLLLVAPLRLSLKDKRKEKHILLAEFTSNTGKFVSELRSTTFCMLGAMAASLQVMRGFKNSTVSAKLKRRAQSSCS